VGTDKQGTNGCGVIKTASSIYRVCINLKEVREVAVVLRYQVSLAPTLGAFGTFFVRCCLASSKNPMVLSEKVALHIHFLVKYKLFTIKLYQWVMKN